MGTDIWLETETRGLDGAWSRVQGERFSLGGWMNSFRNYTVFGVLAGVRGDEDVPSISVPRGLPDDVSKEVSKCQYEGDLGDHSFSHVYLHELLNYNWQHLVYMDGWLSADQFITWKAKGGGTPSDYGSGPVGPCIYYVSLDTMMSLVEDGYRGDFGKDQQGWNLKERASEATMALLDKDAFLTQRRRHEDDGEKFEWERVTMRRAPSFYVQVHWKQSVAELAGEFLSEFVPMLGELGKPDSVRIVFGFDS